MPNDVVANAAVVRRHDDGDDGDWVGQSNDYRFRIVPKGTSQDEDTPEGEATPEGTPEPVPEKGFPFPDELAGTGPASRRGLLGTAAAGLLLIATGAGAMLIARRRR
ncbi:hypothetical protein ACQEVY_29720 [Streptomyces sp. CA-288835]|uniref:hypothetical protein n=1 Tax=Streptomyces sp. CA-288835 TaxID=3240069 RepID=UPI003D943CCC